MSDTKIGLAENLSGVVAYVLGFITGIVLLVIEKENKFVRFHAAQSTVVFGGLFIISIVLGFIPVIGWLIALLLPFVGFVLWIYLMFMAYKGNMYRLPVVADFADKLENAL
ncbi:MAG: DUF4870 domain-containing protein [Methanolobus sp.]|uniref:DUF4870 domain-containing protein n=1 Tax=Methanolobus sp. TaxID=1874737 RepID=UPI002730CAFA|nr:DUF4870 domain-containing protein [Methanolobus sp.]MDP2218166.1 DUF4870 domain-containing protein [Methanolobus sp.]